MYISTLSGLKNIEKTANKVFNVPNHLKFILHYKTWAVVKDRKYVLVHAIKCIIANLFKLNWRFLGKY